MQNWDEVHSNYVLHTVGNKNKLVEKYAIKMQPIETEWAISVSMGGSIFRRFVRSTRFQQNETKKSNQNDWTQNRNHEVI